MAARYDISADAQTDLQEIKAYYLQRADGRVARYVLGEIGRAFRFLAATPGPGIFGKT